MVCVLKVDKDHYQVGDDCGRCRVIGVELVSNDGDGVLQRVIWMGGGWLDSDALDKGLKVLDADEIGVEGELPVGEGAADESGEQGDWNLIGEAAGEFIEGDHWVLISGGLGTIDLIYFSFGFIEACIGYGRDVDLVSAAFISDAPHSPVTPMQNE